MSNSVMNQEKIAELAKHYEAILKLIGEDPSREGLVKTPMRAAKALWYITEGYRSNPRSVIHEAVFEYAGSRLIIVKDIEFYSMCEHHILPFFGKVSIGYIPSGNMIGLSKLARLVNVFSRRLQVQERLAAQICRELYESLPAKGVIVRIEAEHMCMKMRGVEKQDSRTITLDYVGLFENDMALRNEFISNI